MDVARSAISDADTGMTADHGQRRLMVARELITLMTGEKVGNAIWPFDTTAVVTNT